MKKRPGLAYLKKDRTRHSNVTNEILSKFLFRQSFVYVSEQQQIFCSWLNFILLRQNRKTVYKLHVLFHLNRC